MLRAFRGKADGSLLLAAALAALAACELPTSEGPQTGSPGLEPPHGLDGGGPIGSAAGSGPGASPVPGDSTGLPADGSDNGEQTPGTTAGAGSQLPTDGTGAFADAGADADGPRNTDDPLFVGLWVVEQPNHALYEATLYELLAGGTLSAQDTYLLGAAPYDGYVTGTVEHATSGVRCWFDDHWASLGARTLELGLGCTDDATRSVQLQFPDGDPALGLVPTVIAVDGEPDWAHRDFDWSFRKCASLADCQPF